MDQKEWVGIREEEGELYYGDILVCGENGELTPEFLECRCGELQYIKSEITSIEAAIKQKEKRRADWIAEGCGQEVIDCVDEGLSFLLETLSNFKHVRNAMLKTLNIEVT